MVSAGYGYPDALTYRPYAPTPFGSSTFGGPGQDPALEGYVPYYGNGYHGYYGKR